MLINLSIIDLAVVKALDLDLCKGMSVLTGETGAGKSILLTALGLALGDRADSGYVRPGSKRAEINLEFALADAASARHWLEAKQLDDGPHCLVRRVVNQDGRSKAYINNRPVTLQALQELSGKLVEIHGQHAHLTLLNGDEQRRLLDAFAGNQALLDQLNACYRQWQQAHKELSALLKASADQTEREELLRYQIDELQQLDVKRFDYAALSEEHDRLANLGQIFQVGQGLLDGLYENDAVCANSLLNHGVAQLNQIAHYAPELQGVAGLLTEAQIQVAEAALQLRRFLDSQEADPARMAELENRLSVIHGLSRKHQIKPEDLPTQLAKLEHELALLAHGSERIAALQAHTGKLLADYRLLADQLSQRRRSAGGRLQQQITAAIKELGMPQGEFLVALDELPGDAPKLHGKDQVCFMVSANPGLPPKPLAKVASGGELSRISLAIQVTTSNDKTTPTMIFDEVDSGIGGSIAEIVGQKLRALSQNRQVLCVTHLPQVAAQAHYHLYVQKNHETDITSSNVRLLADDERVEEVARMLGGVNITANTLAHAEEMLSHARAGVAPVA